MNFIHTSRLVGVELLYVCVVTSEIAVSIQDVHRRLGIQGTPGTTLHEGECKINRNQFPNRATDFISTSHSFSPEHYANLVGLTKVRLRFIFLRCSSSEWSVE
uniref:Putative secreted protein n=1 Tax=Anopheles triannulatus TaxID=58253 RepID=A0A2M4B4G6_9DIPT